ncbi:F-box-like domain superfamily [Sesbania bispinosa]|nr:F-box-like domain superfamily [Sesbania bispinosa]
MAPTIDMLSLLPDSLLSAIVSLLPFKDAVRTSVLSKNWLNICKTTTNIEFNELFFVQSDETNDKIKEAQRKAFLEFINIWIDNHKGNGVEMFSLKLKNPKNAAEVVKRCIAFATQENVYGHSCLQNLKLFSCSFVETKLRNFHALKEVSLGWIELKVSAIKALLSSCKMLESLSLKMCCNIEDFDLGEVEENLSFSTIKLNSPVLEEVALDFTLGYDLMERDGPSVYNLMQVLHNVRVLTVCSFLLQVAPTRGQAFGLQRDMKVKHLIMKIGFHWYEFSGITFFLNSCSALECLTIQLGCFSEMFDYEELIEIDYEGFWIDIGGDYKCMTSTLKEVEIKGFIGTKHEIRMLKYFITNGKVLKKMSINLLRDKDPNEDWNLDYYRRDVAEGMKKVPKASRDLEIFIS